MTGRRIFTIAPGVPFLRTLASTLCAGELVDGFRLRAGDPLALAAATIYVPTRRAARALRSEFVDISPAESAILPVIRALGEDDDSAGFFEEEADALENLPPAGSTERLLELASLVLAWKQQLPQAVADVHGDHPLLAPANPADAIWLARNLADLLDAMETEERPWSALKDISLEDHAQWWQLTLEFLKIATEFWPARLAELGRTDPARRRNLLLRAEAERLRANPPEGPVIVAGSTGSIPATAELMRAVSDFAMGAVVLPGLDLDMDDATWMLVGGDPDDTGRDPAICAHPQYGLFILLSKLGATRSDVASLGQPAPELGERNRLTSRALVPAPATAGWAAATIDESSLAAALDGVEILEAANERQEAAAIAVAIRLAAEPQDDGTGDQRPRDVALVTPDRNLARRVAAELARFGITANDSGGLPLPRTPPATLMQLLLQTALKPGNPVALLSLLKHPLARFGMTAADARKAARIVERVALRGANRPVPVDTLPAFFETRLGERLETTRHAPQWQKRLGEREIELARELCRQTAKIFAMVGEDAASTPRSLRDWAFLTGQAMEEAAIDETDSLSSLWDNEAGEKLSLLLADLAADRSAFACSGNEWADAATALIATDVVKPRAGAHPHIFIWGALEARLLHVDTMIMAGLNEGTWPTQTSADPLLSRMMKATIGLEPPERRIGLAAHDFQMNIGAPHVILSRSARAGNAPTVASRWLQRLTALAGESRANRMRARGNRYTGWAEALDTLPTVEPAERPDPKPPAASQPKRYSFSEVRTLRRDPYAIYARRILRLDPPEDLSALPGPAERGTLFHRILEEFTGSGVAVTDPDALDALRQLTEKAFDESGLHASASLIWRSQFDALAEAYLDWERKRDGDIAKRHTEVRAAFEVEACGTTLSGVADRIDIRHDGKADILDYKTGMSPSRKVAWTMLDPQLPLEAAALRAGAFREIGPLEPESLSYVRLRPGNQLKVDRIEGKIQGSDETRTASDLADLSIERFAKLVNALAGGALGFASQVIPDPTAQYGREYDHLARVREWSAFDDDEGEQ